LVEYVYKNKYDPFNEYIKEYLEKNCAFRLDWNDAAKKYYIRWRETNVKNKATITIKPDGDKKIKSIHVNDN